MPTHLKNSAMTTRLEKINFCSHPEEGQHQRMFKLPQNCTHCIIALISHASKVMLKILQVRLQQYMNQELPDVQAGFRKGRGTRDQIAKNSWIIEKAGEFQKNIYFCFFDCAKASGVWITTNHGKFLKRKGRREVNWELGVNMYTLLNTKQITNKYLYIAQGTIFNI